MGMEMAALVERHRPFAPGDTSIASGHHTEDRLWISGSNWQTTQTPTALGVVVYGQGFLRRIRGPSPEVPFPHGPGPFSPLEEV